MVVWDTWLFDLFSFSCLLAFGLMIGGSIVLFCRLSDCWFGLFC